TSTLLQAGLKHGATVGAIVRHAEVVSTIGAFALLCEDGTVVTWGDADFGADSAEVQEQLKDVQQICGSDGAFAALLADGFVVTWGDEDFGGNSSAVQDQLLNVLELQAFGVAFAATLADGTTVCWGSQSIQTKLQHARRISASNGACAIIKDDGSVVAWGHAEYGADTSKVSDQLSDVQHIQATWTGAFSAIRSDGTV
ncbi:GAE4, partial [Symbiodinium necroappetens]